MKSYLGQERIYNNELSFSSSCNVGVFDKLIFKLIFYFSYPTYQFPLEEVFYTSLSRVDADSVSTILFSVSLEL